MFAGFKAHLGRTTNKSIEKKLELNNDPGSIMGKVCGSLGGRWAAFYYQAVDWHVMVLNAYLPPAARIGSENCKLVTSYECALEQLKSTISSW